jgi:hypothetical protein
MIEHMTARAATVEDAPAGASSTGSPAPSVGWASGPLGEVQAADRAIARATAVRARAVAEFAATRPASADRPQGEHGAMSAERWAGRAAVLRPVSEWATQELAVALSLTARAAEELLERSLTLVHRLPWVLAALEAGRLHAGHLWCLLEHVAPITDDVLRAQMQAELLAWLAARGRVTTPAQLGDRVRRVVAQYNARNAARDLARALQQRGISVRPERTTGLSAVTVVCATPEAQALYRALGACAGALADDPDAPPRSRGEKLVDCLLELVLRPGESELPPVQVLLTVVAGVSTLLGGDAPGEVDGQLVPAEMLRRLVYGLAGRPAPADAEEDAGSGSAAHAVPPDGRAAGEGAARPGRRVTDPTDTGPTDTRPTDTDPTDTRPTDTGPTKGGPTDADPTDAGPFHPGPTDAAGGPVERAAVALDGVAFDRWLEDLVRHGFGDAPAPGEPDWSPGAPPGPAEWDPGPEPGLEGRVHPGGPADLDESGDLCPPGTRADVAGGGWWAAADRAVDDAGTAVHAARLALGAAQRMVATARRADAADEASWAAGAAGRVTAATDALAALAAAADDQREQLAELLATTGGGGLADRPRLALTDAVTGALLALTDARALRVAATCGRPVCRRRPASCQHALAGLPGVGVPGPSPGYRPSAELDRFVRARDRRCRFPGCRRRVPRAGELDHTVPHPDGPTAAANLAGYCTGDHRGKHQAPGWRHTLTPDGTLTVTTPSGLTAVTEPPPY